MGSGCLGWAALCLLNLLGWVRLAYQLGWFGWMGWVGLD